VSTRILQIPAAVPLEAVADGETDVFEQAAARVEAGELLARLRRLPKRDRRVLCQRYGIGCRARTVRELAAEMHVGVATAHAWEEQALTHIRALYGTD
jgi:DNA-directed RNA polymerase sigma subunit (sigma70/sigma32)